MMSEMEVSDYLTEALSDNDMIEAIGLEKYLQTMHLESGLHLSMDYFSKYSEKSSNDENGITVWVQCPICGKAIGDNVEGE